MATTHDPTLREQNDCGCCAGITEATPLAVANRPGLSAVSYRIGVYDDFRQSLLAALSSADYPALSELGTRQPDDPTIALLDAWAVALDILTFYQERIANENYLRTATECRSVRELVRALGYELAPGVAATAYLAFRVEDAPGTAGHAIIPPHSPVQSVPGPDEKPQTFETEEELIALAEFNELRPIRTKPQNLGKGQNRVLLKGTQTNLKVGDPLLLVGNEWRNDPRSDRWDFRRIIRLLADKDRDRTEIFLDRGLGSQAPFGLPASSPDVYALRKRAALFGHNAPDWTSLADGVKAGYLGKPESDLSTDDRKQWPDYTLYAPDSAARALTEISISPTPEFVAGAVTRALAQAVAAEVQKVVQAAQTVVTELQRTGEVALNEGKNFNHAMAHVADTAANAINGILSLSSSLLTLAIPGTPTFNNVLSIFGTFAGILRSALGPIAALADMFGAFDNANSTSEQNNKTQDAMNAVLTPVVALVNNATSGIPPFSTATAAAFRTLTTTLNKSIDGLNDVGRSILPLTTSGVNLVGAIEASAILGAVTQAALPLAKNQLISGTIPPDIVTPAQFVAGCVIIAALALQLDTGTGVEDIAQTDLDQPFRDLFKDDYPNNEQALRDAFGELFGTNGGQLGINLSDLIKAFNGDAVYSVAKKAIGAAIEAVQDQKVQTWRYDKRGNQVDLDAVYSEVAVGHPVVFATPNYEELLRVDTLTETTRAEYLLTGKVSRLTLAGELENVVAHARVNTNTLPEKQREAEAATVRETSVFLQDEWLELAEDDDTSLVEGATITLDHVLTNGLLPGHRILVQGFTPEATAKPIAETAIVASASGSIINLMAALKNRYRRADCRIFANVVAATHGETKNEVLGNGDATRTFQAFTLKSAPLTYTPDDSPDGAASTLEVQVNDVLWREVESFFGQGLRNRVYTVRRDDDGNATIRFGDGQRGMRLPTGSENVTATYRQGIGHDGRVGAGTLTQLLRRPFGVNSVTNPLPAEGAADPQQMENARENAPQTVLTMGRIVSLSDYADFALGFAGITKALATWIWEGDRRGVLLTVAGENAAMVAEDSRLYANLSAALRAAGDERIPVRLRSYRPIYFTVHATLTLAPEYRAEMIATKAQTALTDQFAFDRRQFGQSIARSEIIALLQRLRGVVAVNVHLLTRTDGSGAVYGLDASVLRAALPSPGMNIAHLDNGQSVAELLFLDPQKPSKISVVNGEALTV